MGSAAEVHDIETSSSPSKGKKELACKSRKEKAGGTSKVTPIQPEKEASSQRVGSSLKGLSNLSIPDDLRNFDFDDPKLFKFRSPVRGDAGVPAPIQGEKTPVSKATGPSGGSTRTHTDTCISLCIYLSFTILLFR